MNKQERSRLIKLIEKQLDRGKSKDWQNRDFEYLSNLLRRNVKVYLSSATLKRFFGKVKVPENYRPQKSTLKALMDFSKYYAYDEQRKLRYKLFRKGLLIGFTVIALFLVSALLWFQSRKVMPSASITLLDLEGRGPSTAFFSIEKDSLSDYHLDFGDGTFKRPLSLNREIQLHHFYEYPGYFKPTVWYNDAQIKEAEGILIPTRDWEVFSHYFADTIERYHPVPFHASQSETEFHVPKYEIRKAGLDTTKVVVVRLDNYKLTKVLADNFRYRVNIKNQTFWPGVRCYSTIISIQGTEDNIEFKFVGEGCSGFSMATLGKETFSGNLTDLVIDNKIWNAIEIVNKDKQVLMKVNGELKFEGAYSNSLGELVGTSVIFHGSGSVKALKLECGGATQFELLNE